MQAEDLVFWLDVLPEQPDDGAAALCRRHADAMVVPRGWTLDDLRDPDLHLFRPPLPAPTLRTRVPRPPRQRAGADATGEQLRFQTDVISAADIDVVGDAPVEMQVIGDVDDRPAPVDQSDPWTPAFDEADDLDGLLSARSPLLSRAFRIADRHDD
jgi:hypothetical protein